MFAPLFRSALLSSVAFLAIATAGCGSTKCGPSNCTGCCSVSGVCEAPSSDSCGVNGNTCTSCLSSEVCNDGVCGFGPGATATVTGTVGGSSTGSSHSSGSTGASTSSPFTTASGASSGGSSHGAASGASSGTVATSASTSGTPTVGTSGNSSSSGTLTTGPSTSIVGSSSSGTLSTATSSSGGTLGTSTSSGTTIGTSSGGSTGTTAGICSSCALDADCASGYCNTSVAPGYCDSTQACVSGGTAAQSCSPYSCGSDGNCICPTTTTTSSSGSTGSTGSITENGGDSCITSAPVLELNQPVSGNTQGYPKSFIAAVFPDGGPPDSCYPQATFPDGDCQGPAAVYTFTPPSTGTYVVSAIPDATYDVTVTVFEGACHSPIESCVAGIDTQPAGGEESADVTLDAATLYYVVVGGFADDAGNDGFDYGTYTLEVATPPACVTSDLGLMGPGTSADVAGDTSTATQTYSGTCTSLPPASAAYYSFTTTATADLTATVSTTDTGYQPVLALGTGCGTAFAQTLCTSAATTSTSISVTSLPPGSYTLAVSGTSILGATAGPFTLSASLSTPIPPPGNNTCAGATPLTLTAFSDGGLEGSVVVSNLGALNTNIGSVSGGCAGNGRGGSVVYEVDLANPVNSLSATLTPAPDGGLDEPEVSIQESPCYENTDGGTNPSELTCLYDTTDTEVGVATTSLRAGTYFIWVGELDTGVPGYGTLRVTVP